MELIGGIKEAEITKTTKMLQDYGSDIEDVLAGKKGIDSLETIISIVSKLLGDGNLNLFDKMLANYLLGESHNVLIKKTCSPQEAQFNNPIVWKAVYFYRMALLYVEGIFEKKQVALFVTAKLHQYSALIQLGDVYSHMGRFQDGIECYKNAALLYPNDYKWKFHFGFTLFDTHSYYERSAERFVVSLMKDLLKDCLDKKEYSQSANYVYGIIKDWQTPDLKDDRPTNFESTEDDEYNHWVNQNVLRLNAYNDINFTSTLCQEDSLYFDGVYSPKTEPDSWRILFQMLNEVKQEYVSARYMLYSYFKKSGSNHVSDKNVRLADLYDRSNYSFHLELAKSAFRSLYSILDKIAFALNDYLDLKMNPERVNFSNVWYENSKSYRIKEEILKYKSLYSLAGLLFIRNDIYGGADDYLQAEETRLLKKVRNAIEHRAIIIVDDGILEDDGSVLNISRMEFEGVSVNLIKTVRQAIFCFVNAVNHIEYDKKLEITKNGEMIIPQEIDPVKDDEKV
jgi:hypothetical protein